MFDIYKIEALERWQILQHCGQYEEADKLEKELHIKYNINDIVEECEKINLIKGFIKTNV